jgi:hypothetical protein
MTPYRFRVRFPVGADFRHGSKNSLVMPHPLLGYDLHLRVVAEWVVIDNLLVKGGVRGFFDL